MINLFREDFQKIYKYRYVIYCYVTINLRMRYRRSVIGFLWTVLAPLLQYLIIAFIFIYALGRKQENFFPYFFTGSVIFNLCSLCLQRAPSIMLVNELYIKKIYLPKTIYILNICAYEFTNFAFSALTLFGLGCAFGALHFTPALLVIPLQLPLLAVILLGMSALLSVAGVFFRDLIYIIPQTTQALFFLTPIIYKIDVFPPWMQNLIMLNPFYHLIELFRTPITEGHLAAPEHYYFAFGFAILAFGLGYSTIKKYDNRIIFKL